ncbi:unnamed protein product [Clonostachys chloroleuca]|uniref:Altered inheritance of mitochondria protein 32 n=1 Tax=Clonostachys chloroleuca TaxID=1926264 RepID=A0AA35MFS9_9HYPO|nr:unnamed protein product [Clonostachys chloroleuca]
MRARSQWLLRPTITSVPAARRCFAAEAAAAGSSAPRSSGGQSERTSRLKPKPPPFPTIPTCPSPTCSCASMPEDLDIDHKSPLNGVMAGYAEHVLVCTGQDDWVSRIEEENSGDNLAADLKELFGRGGKYRDPFHNVSVLNSSMPSSIPPRREVQTTSAYILPSFKYVPFLPRVSFEAVQALAKGYLLPTTLHTAHGGLSPIHRDLMTRDETYRSLLPGVQDVDEVLVLICGHGGRDARCGVMGPLLRGEFEEKLGRTDGFEVRRGPVVVRDAAEEASQIEGSVGEEEKVTGVRVGLVSHIGGHKFAGNVIIYLPPKLLQNGGKPHPLAGKGIWYGRVEPKHVEGLVNETVVKGNVVEDMFRGGIDSDRKILRL